MLMFQTSLQFSVLLFLILVTYISCKDKADTCVVEHSNLIIGNKRHSIVWKSRENVLYSVVTSEPPCLDEYNKTVVKVCFNGTWLPLTYSTCATIEENPLCPPNFIQKDRTCTYVTEARTWKEGCFYPGSLSSTDNKYTSWLPVSRKNQFGTLQYTNPGRKYGLHFDEEDSSESSEDLLIENQDCAITTSANDMELADCNSRFSHVCSYKHDHFLYNCPSDCVPGGLLSKHCFCKVTKNVTAKRNLWCEELAQPTYAYQRTILQNLAGNDECWVGNLGLDSYNLYLAVSKRGWSLQEDATLTCAVCQIVALSPPKVDMLLKFNSKKFQIYLTVYSPEGLLQTDDEDPVYCFTDATGKLKTRVDVEEIWDSMKDERTSTRLKVYEIKIVGHNPGYYWCEAFQLPDASLIKSNRIIGHKEFKGHEYALRLRIHNYCRLLWFDHCKNPNINMINVIGKKLIFSDKCLARFTKSVRLYHIYNVTKQNQIDVLFHLSSESKIPFTAEYYTLQSCSEHLAVKYWNYVEVIFFKSSEACMQEETVISNRLIHWKTSAIGKLRIPNEVCVQDDGTPVKRMCEGDFIFGSEWAKIDGKCSENITLCSRTQTLYSFLNLDISDNLTRAISNITEDAKNLTVLDLRYLTEVLSKVPSTQQSCSNESLDEFIAIFDNLMNSNGTVLRQSQSLLNVTDEILDIFESILTCLNISTDSYLLRKNNLLIHFNKPFQSNISGIALYDSNANGSDFVDLNVKYLYYENINVTELFHEENLDIATYIPDYLLNTISQNVSQDVKNDIIVITTIFSKDNFFNTDVNKTKVVSSRIVSVTIPGYGEYLKTPLPIIFKSQASHSDKDKCAFWNYGINSETHSGYWSTIGGTHFKRLNSSGLEICYFSHLTNFALLVLNDPISVNDDSEIAYDIIVAKTHDTVLDVITSIGCILSVFGICGILMTSFIFESWRSKLGTRILIQLCVTILLQIILLNLADYDSASSYNSCTFWGVLLHYVILSEFSWMLVAAILQFFRFVKVIGPIPNRLILKTMLVGWGLPLLPVLIVCLVDLKTYSTGPLGFCYPTGLSLYLGVLLPVTAIVSVNLGIFFAVVHNVFILKVETRGKSQTLLKRQICLTVLLFFLLGFPWVFGLLAEITSSNSIVSFIFIYLFCILATLQGFVLFVFYVILDENTRGLWYSFLKRLFKY